MVKYLFIFMIICACSKGGGRGAGQITTLEEQDPLASEMNGMYQALLTPTNKKVAALLNGALTLVRENNEFIADIRFSAGPASVLHSQHIHIGNRCPRESDDLNGDGYIDAEEGFKIYKEILIPLDDDISSQRMGLGIFPAADDFGYYYYSRATDFNTLMKDLKEEDINLSDDYVKLRPREVLTVTDKVVVILGVPEAMVLPDSVSGRGRLNKHQALPVACGVIRELTTVPGVIDNDYTGIPLPNGGSIGGSNGMDDDGADFSTPATPEDPGNYGEDDTEVAEEEDEEEPTPEIII
ncbi:MAG: hypothetical protein NDI69_15125 [Bacteriovoracaceae bacterium]|nr:hypothetical protein [Bacteriovoracaceae bacterium]